MGAIHAALGGTDAGRAYLPWVWELAADRAGISVDRMSESPTELVAAVRQAAELVESDGLVVLVNSLSDASLPALRRLAETTSDRDRVAVVPGPRLVGERHGLTDSDDREELVVDLARAALDARVDVLAVDEPDADGRHEGCFRTLARVAAFYGARTIVIGSPDAAFAIAAGFDGVDAGDDGPVQVGVPVGPHHAAAVVTTSWKPRSRDPDALRARAREVRCASAAGEP